MTIFGEQRENDLLEKFFRLFLGAASELLAVAYHFREFFKREGDFTVGGKALQKVVVAAIFFYGAAGGNGMDLDKLMHLLPAFSSGNGFHEDFFRGHKGKLGFEMFPYLVWINNHIRGYVDKQL